MSKICLLILVTFCSGILTLIEEDFYEFSYTETPSCNLVGIKEEVSDLDHNKRKEIVNEYLKTLNKVNDGWIDPDDMMSHYKPKSSSPSLESVKTNIDNEYKPVFSDIRGEIIGSNSLIIDESDALGKDSGKLFSNPKHQICVLDSIYISRWLKMLIMKIETDSYFEPTSLVIPLNSDSLSEIKTISTKTINIGELDELVSKLISKTMVTSKEMFDWTHFAWISLYIVSVIILVILSLGLYIVFIRRPLWTIFVLFILVCIFWHWMQLYEKQIAHKHSLLVSEKFPSSCRKNDFGFFESVVEYTKSYFRASDCSEYYEALMVNPFWEVSLSVAITETVSAVIFQPLYTGSKAVNASVKLLFHDLDLKLICIVVLFLFLIIILYFRYRIQFPYFMAVIEPVPIERSYVEDVKPYKTFDTIKDSMQKFVERIDNTDRNISRLLQDELLHRVPIRDSSKRYGCIKNVISKQGYEENCKSVDCFRNFKFTCKECEKPLEFASNEHLSDQESKVEGKMKSFHSCIEHCDASDKNSESIEDVTCTECNNFTISNYREPNNFIDTAKNDFLVGSCSACESNESKQNVANAK